MNSVNEQLRAIDKELADLESRKQVLYHSGKLTGQTDPVPRAHFCDPICAG